MSEVSELCNPVLKASLKLRANRISNIDIGNINATHGIEINSWNQNQPSTNSRTYMYLMAMCYAIWNI